MVIEWVLLLSRDRYEKSLFICSSQKLRIMYLNSFILLLLLIMSQHEKLLSRFLSIPKDFSYGELKTLLHHFGYIEETKGRTSGSRVEFVNQDTENKIKLHKPHHSSSESRPKTLKEIITLLKKQGVIG